MSLWRVLFAAFSFSLLAGGATAQTPDASPTDEPGDARRRIDDIYREIEVATEKEQALLAGLEEIEQDIAARADDLRSIQVLLERHRTTSEEHRTRMEDLERSIKDRRRWLRERLRGLYVHGRPGTLKVLFAAESYGDLVRRTKFSRIVARRDTALVAELRKDLDEVARSRTDYEQELVALESELEKSRGRNEELELQRADRERLLTEVKSDRMSAQKIRDELDKASAALGNAVGSLVSGGAAPRAFTAAKGRLLPPLAKGQVKLPFGPYQHPTLGLPMKHQGIMWACGAGEEVRVVFDGRVEMAAWLSSYGKVIVVDHGDGWRTLYAHNSELLRKKGESVREGEVIARTGDTASFEGPELFFALYREKEPVDPAQWFVTAP